MVDDDPAARLTDRQRECLRLVGQLKKTEQIAGELGIAPSTVNTHIERAVALLGAVNRREAARIVMASDARPEKTPTDIHRLPETPALVPDGPTKTEIGRRRNELTWGQRLGLALLALVLMCIGLAGLSAAIEQLSPLALHDRQRKYELIYREGLLMTTNALELAARAVYADFAPAEAAADVAAARTARLLATLLEQRAAANISIGSGALLVRKLAKSFAAQIEAREDFIMAHKLASRLPSELGISPHAYGDTEECPPSEALEEDNVVRLAVA